MDATRISDGRIVFLKRVKKASSERSIAEYFSSEEVKEDPRNHCVPLLDSFDDPFEIDVEILVMPLLRAFADPRFETVHQVLDFARQILEVRQNSLR